MAIFNFKSKSAFIDICGTYNNIPDLIRDAGINYSDKYAFRSYDNGDIVSKTYTTFSNDVFGTAQVIRERYADVKQIGLLCYPSYECFTMAYAIMCAGKVAVMMDINFAKEEVEHEAEKFDAEVLWGKEEIAEICAAGHEKAQTGYEIQTVDPDTHAVILLTSGTTGERKGVVLSHRNVACGAGSAGVDRAFMDGAKFFFVLPVYHMYGLTTLTLQIAIGAETDICDNIRYFQKRMAEFKPDIICAVPMMMEAIYKNINHTLKKQNLVGKFGTARKYSNGLRKIGIDRRQGIFAKILEALGGNLKVMISGGAFLDSDIAQFFDDIGISVYIGYGLTETATFSSVNTERSHRKGSIGVAAPCNEVRVQDGEIQIKGDNIMVGYYGDPAATEAVFEDGWFKTGDLGEIDDKGYIYITGRIKNLIILSNGENVSPEELETNLMRSEYVDEVVVREKNGKIHADIYCEALTKMTKEEADAILKQVIVDTNRDQHKYKYIETYEMRTEPFLKTHTMKIKRNS